MRKIDLAALVLAALASPAFAGASAENIELNACVKFAKLDSIYASNSPTDVDWRKAIAARCASPIQAWAKRYGKDGLREAVTNEMDLARDAYANTMELDDWVRDQITIYGLKGWRGIGHSARD